MKTIMKKVYRTINGREFTNKAKAISVEKKYLRARRCQKKREACTHVFETITYFHRSSYSGPMIGALERMTYKRCRKCKYRLWLS
ncbi:hypothetical protein LCGC14_2667410 [marine sediment metagenome]|uniref:Uncharacterized protein n=1 Tax=marine sediment metagenome TaxID=412755 RepID=A0A0F9C087_9ZZZZ